MKRNTVPENRLPDAINSDASADFSIISNKVIRNPELSAKAKCILFILLSNQSGWMSYINAVNSMMKEGTHTIQYGLKELEDLGYLKRFKYRDKITKSWVGSFWAYTATPGKFRIKKHLKLLDERGWEVVPKNPEVEKPDRENPYKGLPYKVEPTLRILTDNNTKSNNTNSKNSSHLAMGEEDAEESKNELFPFVTESMFDKFYTLYPKKKDKGAAKSAWDKVCKLPKKRKPTWEDIKTAIQSQSKTKLWTKEGGKYIKYPSTWLSKNGWLNDPEEMNDDFDDSKIRTLPVNENSTRFKSQTYQYKK